MTGSEKCPRGGFSPKEKLRGRSSKSAQPLMQIIKMKRGAAALEDGGDSSLNDTDFLLMSEASLKLNLNGCSEVTYKDPLIADFLCQDNPF